MKNFKLLLLSLLLLVPLQANASWILQQNADGGTYWVDTDDSDTAHVTEGRVTVFMPDITVASTGYVAAPIKGDIVNAYVTLYGQISTTTSEHIRLFLGKGNSTATGSIPSNWSEVTNAVTGITIHQSAVTGTVFKTATDYTANRSVTENGVIAIHSPGNSASASSATVPALITIIINPR